jgi:hypothetical protein
MRRSARAYGRKPSRNEAPLKTIDHRLAKVSTSEGARNLQEFSQSSGRDHPTGPTNGTHLPEVQKRAGGQSGFAAFCSVSGRMENAEDGARDRIRGCRAVVAGEIARLQSEANADDNAGAQRKASAEPFEKGISEHCVPNRCEPAPAGAAGNTGPIPPRNEQKEVSAAKRELESESQNGNPSVMALIGSVSQRGSSAAANSLINTQLGEQ